METFANGVVCEQANYPLLDGFRWAEAGDDIQLTQLDVQRVPSTGHPAVQVGFTKFDPQTKNTTAHFVLFDLATARPLSAMAQPSAQDCGGLFTSRGHGADRQVVFLGGDIVITPPFQTGMPTSGGWLSLDQGGGPPAMGTRVEAPASGYPTQVRPSLSGVFEWRGPGTGLHHVPWEGTPSKVTQPGPEQLVLVPSGGALLSFAAEAVGRPPVAAWFPETGLVPLFLGPPAGKTDEGVATDGVDIVWDRIPSDWKDHSPGVLMTAPFSPDPAVVAKGARTLKSVARYSESAVGCGLSSRRLFTNEEAALEIVRLSDGGTWRIAEHPELKLVPLFLDCNTLYVRFERTVMGFHAKTLGRIQLDSLGPPTFPN